MDDSIAFKIEEINFPSLKVMYIPVTVPYEEMRNTRLFFMKLGLYAFTKRGKPTGNVFIRYVGETPDMIDMEICFGVEEFLPETKEIKAKVIEEYGGKFAICYYKGSREDLPSVYVKMQKWFLEQNLQRRGDALIEYYVNDSRKFPASELLTELYWPIIANVTEKYDR